MVLLSTGATSSFTNNKWKVPAGSEDISMFTTCPKNTFEISCVRTSCPRLLKILTEKRVYRSVLIRIPNFPVFGFG
jgi:hypothetical protein